MSSRGIYIVIQTRTKEILHVDIFVVPKNAEKFGRVFLCVCKSRDARPERRKV